MTPEGSEHIQPDEQKKNPEQELASLHQELAKQLGKEFTPAFLTYLETKDPVLYKDLNSANAEAKGRETGVYTKNQLAVVAEYTQEYAKSQWTKEMKARRVQNVDAVTFEFRSGESPLMIAHIPSSLGPIDVVNAGKEQWTVFGVPYSVKAADVFLEVSFIQRRFDEVKDTPPVQVQEEWFKKDPILPSTVVFGSNFFDSYINRYGFISVADDIPHLVTALNRHCKEYAAQEQLKVKK